MHDADRQRAQQLSCVGWPENIVPQSTPIGLLAWSQSHSSASEVRTPYPKACHPQPHVVMINSSILTELELV